MASILLPTPSRGSPLSLDDWFEELPDTPGSIAGVMDDFAEPSPLQQRFCHTLMSAEDYDVQASSETEKAIEELIQHIEEHPTEIMQLLRKRKKEEAETNGVRSFLKSKLLQMMKGKKYEQGLVTDTECNQKIDELTKGMIGAFNYNKEQGLSRRSHRLAEKRAKLASETSLYSPVGKAAAPTTSKARTPRSQMPPPPPPPPPGPPPAVLTTPSKDVENKKPVRFARRSLRSDKRKSTDSAMSIQDELNTSNPRKRLKANPAQARSPGLTPLYPMQNILQTPDALKKGKHDESLSTILFRAMSEKFQHLYEQQEEDSSVLDHTEQFFSP